MSITVSLTVSCPEHPNYKGRQNKKQICWSCVSIYSLVHPDDLILDCQIEKVEVHSD